VLDNICDNVAMKVRYISHCFEYKDYCHPECDYVYLLIYPNTRRHILADRNLKGVHSFQEHSHSKQASILYWYVQNGMERGSVVAKALSYNLHNPSGHTRPWGLLSL
jgi:hypothetical protein